MIIGMIKAHPTRKSDGRQATLSSATPRASTPRNGRMVSKTTRTQRESRARWRSFTSPLAIDLEGVSGPMDKLAAVSTPTAWVGRLTTLHGLRTTEVRLRWVEEVQAQLEDGS